MKRLPSRELRPEWLGIASINFTAAEDSSARQEMLGSHLSQHLTISGASIRKCLSGVEREFGKTTFSIRVPANAEIRAVVEKYPALEGYRRTQINPVTSVIFENVERGVIDVIDIPYHHCMHNHFGFRYKTTEAAMRLVSGGLIPKDTILADSPSVDSRGNYKIGTELNVAFMSHPGIIEDGVIISESACEKMTATGIEKRAGSFGRKRYPLNLYGQPGGEYKPHPDIGEHIRKDGLLFAFREYDELLAGVEMAEDMLTQVDHVFDRRVYGIPDAKVIDVESRMGLTGGSPRTPVGMDAQALRYHEAQIRYYNEIERRTYSAIGKTRRTIAPKLHRLIGEGLTFKNNSGNRRTKQMYNLQELDEWRIGITFEYKMVPGVGSKITDLHGGKGVIVKKVPDKDMPVDQWGTRAEVIMDGNSTIKRLNPGRFYEQWFNAQGDQLKRRLHEMKENAASASAFYAEAWDLVLDFYNQCSPRMVERLTSADYKGTPKSHIDSILHREVHFWFPTVSPVTLYNGVLNLMAKYPLEKGPVTFTGHYGHTVTSRRPVIIASIYVILLEKTGDEWSGVASTKLNTHGIPAKINKHDKHATPARPMPVRILGESEVRLLAMAAGSQTVGEMVEMSNSPPLHKHVVSNLYWAEEPTNVENVVTDSNLIGRGGRNLAFVQHSLEISGVKLYRAPASDEDPQLYPPADGEPSL